MTKSGGGRMTELQPCKCKSIPYVEKKDKEYMNLGLARGMFHTWFVKCPNCGKTYGDFLSREAAVSAWNRRTNDGTHTR